MSKNKPPFCEQVAKIQDTSNTFVKSYKPNDDNSDALRKKIKVICHIISQIIGVQQRHYADLRTCIAIFSQSQQKKCSCTIEENLINIISDLDHIFAAYSLTKKAIDDLYDLFVDE